MFYHHFISSSCLRTGFLLNSFQTLLSSSRTHLHIAVVHNTAYNMCMICFRVLKIIQIHGQVFSSSTVILFTLPYPLFIFCYCFSSIFYVKRIIHRGFHIFRSLEHKSCRFLLSRWVCQLMIYQSMHCAWHINWDRRFLSLCSIILFQVAT